MPGVGQTLHMTAFTLTVELPESLAQQAQQAGLLTPESIADLLAAELRRQQVERLFSDVDLLAGQDAAPMSDAEIEVEIEQARAERRMRNARRS